MNLNAVLHQISPLDMECLTRPDPAVEQYFQHYGLDFADTMAGVSQHIGSFESGHFDIVCQLFLRQKSQGHGICGAWLF